MTGLDTDRHYTVLLGGDGEMRIKVACGSEAEVTVSRITGAFIVPEESEEREDGSLRVPLQGGPLFVDCTRHGQYLGFVRALPRGPESDEGSIPLSMMLLLTRLTDTEYVSPLGMR